ncbi:competence protein CoiA family protein [Bacillus thuringiensis]|nr:competence protein CoiA family protein [Bacillus thuringiensis]
MNLAIYEGKSFNLDQHLRNIGIIRDKEIDMLKKRADKGAFTCPFCSAALIIKSGQQRDTHFSHSSGESCELVEAHQTYSKQIKRESKKHSVIREIIFDELKIQEKIKPDIHVEVGVVAKANEKWSYYPDIVLQNPSGEIAISVLTSVDRTKDSRLVKQIQKRNKYFQEKGLQTVWFIEEQQLTEDMENHVIHLWESEIDLAIKTKEDSNWDVLLNDLMVQGDAFNIFGYWKKSSIIPIDVRSVYYVYSTEERIEFSVHRFVIDERKFPFKAFALHHGYRIAMTKALSIVESIALSDKTIEEANRIAFQQKFFQLKEEKQRKEKEETELLKKRELAKKQQEALARLRAEEELAARKEAAVTKQEIPNPPIKKMTYEELKQRLREKFGMTQQQQMHLWQYYVLQRGVKNFDFIWFLALEANSFNELELMLEKRRSY